VGLRARVRGRGRRQGDEIPARVPQGDAGRHLGPVRGGPRTPGGLESPDVQFLHGRDEVGDRDGGGRQYDGPPPGRARHALPAGWDRAAAEVLKPAEHGGILSRSGVVEVVSSLDRDGRPVPHDLRWGVYVVITSSRPFIRRCFAEYGMPVDRTGTFAAMYRPFHLVGMELPVSIARAVLDRRPTGTPRPTPVAAVACAAKRPLAAGEILDGEGGYTVYGVIDEAAAARRERVLPIGLSRGARVAR